MPNVIVTPSSVISVKINQTSTQMVRGATTFVGATDVQNQINQIAAQAAAAYSIANTAILYANTGYDFVTYGGSVNGNVAIIKNLTVGGRANVANNLQVGGQQYLTGDLTIGGDFIGTIDGGIFT
jgi:hypothetical protein